jgi:hypothetical protein
MGNINKNVVSTMDGTTLSKQFWCKGEKLQVLGSIPGPGEKAAQQGRLPKVEI